MNKDQIIETPLLWNFWDKDIITDIYHQECLSCEALCSPINGRLIDFKKI